jgi:hypothetical protein
MKVLAISGGTKNGNNDAMAREALMGAQEHGAEVEFIRLHDLNLKPCTGCIACVKGLMGGHNGDCIIKDDFKWLEEKIYDADGIIIVMPVFEKGSPGVMHVLQDRRFGPAHDPGPCTVAKMIAGKKGTAGPDPRKFERKLVSYIGIGGSDWVHRFSADMNLTAMTGSWKVIDDAVFTWAKCAVMEDVIVSKCRGIGVNMANAVKAGIDAAEYKGDPGVCPLCHCRNFYIGNDPKETVCVVCGMVGELVISDGKYTFAVDAEQYEHAHTLMPGKMKHMDDIYKNETKLAEQKQTPEYKERMKKYEDFFQAAKPRRGTNDE